MDESTASKIKKIHAKIQSLIDMGKGGSPECRVFITKLSELMVRYGLTDEQLKWLTDEQANDVLGEYISVRVDGGDFYGEWKGKRNPITFAIVKPVVYEIGVALFGMQGANSFYLAGRERHVKQALELARVVVDVAESSWRTAFAESGETCHGTVYKNNYFTGFGLGVAKALRENRESSIQEFSSNSNALAVVAPSGKDAYNWFVSGTTTHTRTVKSKKKSSSALSAGYSDGKRFNRQLGN